MIMPSTLETIPGLQARIFWNSFIIALRTSSCQPTETSSILKMIAGRHQRGRFAVLPGLPLHWLVLVPVENVVILTQLTAGFSSAAACPNLTISGFVILLGKTVGESLDRPTPRLSNPRCISASRCFQDRYAGGYFTLLR